MTIEKRIADLRDGNTFARAAKRPRELRLCSRCHRLTDVAALLPQASGEEVCPDCDDLAGAADYDREAYARLMADVFYHSAGEKRRRAAWDKWAHRLSLLAFGVMGSLIMLLIWKNVSGGHE